MLQTQTHEIGRHKRHLLQLYDLNPLSQQSLSQRVNIMVRSVHLVRLFRHSVVAALFYLMTALCLKLSS